jgi:peroxiredoxin
MRPARTFLLLAGALTLSGALLAAAPQVGGPAPRFTLTTVDGKTFSLADAARSHTAVVVMFIAT